MEKQTASDFVVDTVGHCFICMNKTSTHVTPINSLQELSQYLKINLKKAFHEEELIPDYLLSKVEKSILKANLCEECASWNAKLSELIRQLEKIEIEAVSYVQLIHDKLTMAGEDDKSDLSSKLADHSSGLMGKLQIAEALRKETANKCSRKIQTSQPKIRIKKFTERNILMEKDKLKHKSRTSKLQQNISSNSADFPITKTEVNDLKLERHDLEETASYTYNNFVDDFEDHNMDLDSEQRCSSPTTDDHAWPPDVPVNVMTSNFKQQKYAKNPDTGKFKCRLCPKESASAPAAHLHYQKVHLKIRFKCTICNKVFSEKTNLMKHQQSIHLKLRFKCNICGKDFSQKGTLTAHQQKCSSQNRI